VYADLVARLAPLPGDSFEAVMALRERRGLQSVALMARLSRNHPDFYARLGAATALGEQEPPAPELALVALIEALGDTDDLVRLAAAEGLERLTGEWASPAHVTRADAELLRTKYRNWFLRSHRQAETSKRR
jgi:HEAT repeat protein